MINILTQIIAVLGLALSAYLFIKLRNHKKKQLATNPALTPPVQPPISNANIEDLILSKSFDSSTISACHTDLKGKIIYSNDQFKELFEITGENLITDTHIWDYTPKDQRDQIESFFSNIELNHPDPKPFIGKKTLKYKKKITVRTSWFYKTDAQGSIKGIIAFFEDITDLNTAKATISQRKQTFRKMLDLSNDAAIICSPAGVILDANGNSSELFRKNRDQIIGTSIFSYCPAEIKYHIEQTNEEAVSHKPFLYNGITFAADNSSTPCQITIYRIEYYGEFGYILFLKDISETLKLKQDLKLAKLKAGESERLKSSFLANLSHEIRTPMNNILGFSDLLIEPTLEEDERKEYIKIIRNSGQSLLNLINDIIDFSKIESGLVTIQKETCDLNELLKDIKKHAITSLSNKNERVEFKLNIPSINNKLVINNDKLRLEQIIRNLVENAIKFTYTGAIDVGYLYKGSNHVEFYVRDSGIGIPEDKIAHIFEKFRQANDSNNREFGGTGLGLSITSQLVYLLGGFMWLESVEKKGSEFRFIIPADFSRKNEFRYHPGKEHQNILLFDKDPENYSNLIAKTASSATRTFWATTSKELVAIIKCNKIDLILLNTENQIQSRHLALLELLKKQAPHISVVALSHSQDTIKKIELLNAGYNDIITLPLKTKSLLLLTSKISENK